MADNSAIFDYIQTTVNSLQSDTESALQSLRNRAMSRFEPWVIQSGYDNNPDWTVADFGSIELPGLGDLPADRPELNLPAFSFNPEDYIRADLLQRYSYQSDFFDNFLDSRLRDYIDSQGYFLAQAVQDALFQQTRERDLQTLNDATDQVDRVQARRGFPLLTSIHMAARNDVIKKFQDTYADRNKEITALIADKSLQEKMHAMDTGIKMEDIRSRFQLEFGRLYWQAADYLIRKYEADIRAELARFQAEVELIKAQLEADLRNVEFESKHEELVQMKQRQRLEASVAEMNANVSTWIKSFEGEIAAAQEAVNYYKSAALGAAGIGNAIDYKDLGSD